MHRQARLAFIVVATAGALGFVSCVGDPIGPDGAPHRIGSIALDPRFPPIMAAAAASDVEPFERVRVTVTDDDGVVRFDSLVTFPANAESVQLPAQVRLPAGTGAEGVGMTLLLRYINAAGDTVFRGGPTRVIVRPDGVGAPPEPVSLELVHTGIGANATRVVISPATGTVVAGTVTVFNATAFDQSGAPIPGTPVVFTTPDPAAAELAAPTSGAVTWRPMRGVARVIATLLNGKADTARIQVSLPASRLVLVSGQDQSAIVGRALPSPVVVRAEADDGVGVEGVVVNFAVASGGGTISRASAVTDAGGLATVEWTLGAAVGAQSITASAPGLPGGSVSVSALALPRIPAQITITDAPGEVIAGMPFTVTAAVLDADGLVVTTFDGPVSIALDPTAGPASAVLLGTGTVSAVAGIATFTGLGLTRAGTGYRLIVSSGPLPQPNTLVDVVPGPPSALRIVGGNNQSGVVATTLLTLLTVRLTDAFDNSIGGALVSFTAVGGHGFEPSSVATNALGHASTRLTLGRVAGSYTVRASVDNAPGVFADFAVTAVPGPAAGLETASGSPQFIVVGSTLQAAPLVSRVVDAYGNPVSGHEVLWSIIAGDESAALDVENTFSDGDGEGSVMLSLPISIGTIVVEASAAGLTGDPQVFTVTLTHPPNLALLFVSEFSGVSVVRLATDSARSVVTCTISSCVDAQNLVINPAGTLVAVPFGSGAVGFISTATATYVGEATDTTLNQPHAAAFTANGAELWVANKFGGESDTGTVSIINPATGAGVAVIEHNSFSEPEGIVIANGRAFVANRAGNSITVINVATRTVTGTIAFSPAASPLHIVATPGGAFVYVSTDDTRVFKINTSSLAVTEIALGGGNSRNMAVHPGGTKVYVATQDNAIAVIDVFTNAVTTISSDSWSFTQGVAISQDGLFGFVTDAELGVVHVFSTLAAAEVFAPAFPINGFSSPLAIVAR